MDRQAWLGGAALTPELQHTRLACTLFSLLKAGRLGADPLMKEKLWLCWGSAGRPDGLSTLPQAGRAPVKQSLVLPCVCPRTLLKGSTQGAQLCSASHGP